MRWPSVLIALALALSLATPAMAQDSVPVGEDEPVRSMGFPPTIKPYFAATIDWDRRGAEAAPSGHFVIGAYRDILGPVTGLLGVSAEAYLRPNAEKLDYGGRILATVF